MFNHEMDAIEPQELEMVKFQGPEKAVRVWFYQRKDTNGDVFEDAPIIACHEQEAAMFGKFHKLIGIGDGVIYFNHIRDSGLKKGTFVDKAVAQRVLQEAFDKELEAARGKRGLSPKYTAVHFDNSFPEEQRPGFTPPR